MVLLLSDDDVVATVVGRDEFRRAVEALESSFVAYESGETSAPATAFGAYPRGASTYEEVEQSLNVPVGLVPSLDAMSLGIVTVRRDHVTRPHSMWQLLFSYETSALLALIEDSVLHHFQVGGQFGVAARWLTAPDAGTVAMIGAGKMARASLRAIAAVRDLREVKVYSPTPSSRQRFAEEMTELVGVPVRAVDSAEEAVRDTEIVQCATNAEVRGDTQVLDADWVAPGALVATMSRNELGEDIAKIARIIPGAAEHVPTVRPDWQPWKRLMETGQLPHLGPDMGAIVAGTAPAREGDDVINVFLGSGVPSHRPAIAVWLYREALEKGTGTTWDLD